MVPTEFVEELRGTWGPAPVDPERNAIWNQGMELLAQVPDLLEGRVKEEGTASESLVRELGSEARLAELEGECVRQFIVNRDAETVHDVVTCVTDHSPWVECLEHLNTVQKSRFRSSRQPT